jgi:hypothetical protein
MSALNIRGATQVVLDNLGPVTLRPNDHIATGGEGSIFKVSTDMVAKLYLEPEKMRQRGIDEKIRLLTKMKHRYIVSPRGLVVTPSGDAIGFYMLNVMANPGAFPMPQIFTNEFYQRQQFNSKHASTLVERVRETFSFAHQYGAIMVDPNELNWLGLFTGSDPEPRVVDVDSWAIGRWPATVVMPSIRDWHSKTFDARSDWFAWAILTFQIYTGIHPYKGTLDGYGRADLEGRMKKNASVFTPGVRLNRAVRDFSCIPGPLLGWYEAVFEKGERAEPPSPFDTGIAAPRAIQILRAVTTGKTGTLVFEKIVGYPKDPVTRVFYCGAALLNSNRLIDLKTKRQITTAQSPACEIIKTENGWLIGQLDRREASFIYVNENNLRAEDLQLRMQAHRVISHSNRMFVVTDQGLTEIKYNVFGEKLVASTGQTWGIMVNSTKWFDSLGILDAFGAKFAIVPFGDKSVAQVRVRELDGFQIVAGKAGHRFVSMIGLNKRGEYSKIELFFDQEYRTYKAWTDLTDGPELNLAILPKGVCATIVRDGELDIFVPTNGNVTKVEDKQITTDTFLSNWENLVIYIQNGEVWSVRTK